VNARPRRASAGFPVSRVSGAAIYRSERTP
jgi:hypothetical protein